MNRRWPAVGRISLAFFCIGWCAGCATGPPKPRTSSSSSGSRTIGELHLFAVPVALDLDSLIGPDGFAVRVYAGGGDRAKGVVIPKGTLEVLMFDGVLPGQDPRSKPPLRVWSFSADELASHATATSIGIGYRFALRWETAAPSGERISVAARYIPPSGDPIYSSVSGISVGSR